MTTADPPSPSGTAAALVDRGRRLDTIGRGATEEVTRRYERSPRDLLRLFVFSAVTLVLVGVTIGVEDVLLDVEQDVVGLFGFMPSTVERILHGALEWFGYCFALAIVLVPLITRRFRLFGYLVVAGAGAAALMQGVLWLVERTTPTELVNTIAERAGIADATSSGEIPFAMYTAGATVLGPFVTRAWRRAGVVALGTLLLARFLASYHLPGNIVIAVPLGAAVGCAVLLAFGRPDRRPTVNAIRLALLDAGLPVREVHAAAVDAHASTPYLGTLEGGGGLLLKVFGEEERAADLMFRTYRFVRLKNVGDDRPFSSLRRTVEHEALVSLVARDVGVRTPRMRGVVRVGQDSMLLAYDAIDGRPLEAVEADAITDDVMRQVFEQMTSMRRHGIAHRDLDQSSVFVAADGQVWVIDFGFAELAVGRDLLDADVAQLLAALSVTTGAARPVHVAIEVLGRDAVAAALPRLQVQALSAPTRAALQEHEGLLAALQREVQEQAGVDDVHFAELERVDRKMVLMVAIVVAATYFLFPQLADLPAIARQVQDAEWGWVPLVVVMSAVTYVGAAFGLAGAVPERVPTGALTLGQVAASFAGKLAPAGLGGMALNVRLLQKQGVDRAMAVSGVGLSTVAGVVAHVSLIGIFLVWAGRRAFGSFQLPDVHWFLIGGLAALALAGIGMALPFTRRMLLERLVPVLARAFDGVSEVIRRPSKVALLLGGSALTSLGNMSALYFSVVAFGGGLSFATVGAVYLVGSAIANAAPTPGGLGAMEAALIGGLVAAGLPNDVAVPAVFLYRLATFRLPILPGWLSFLWLQRHEYL